MLREAYSLKRLGNAYSATCVPAEATFNKKSFVGYIYRSIR